MNDRHGKQQRLIISLLKVHIDAIIVKYSGILWKIKQAKFKTIHKKTLRC